ncbi:uncharacterized protein LOC124452658 isoform X2 [Xenia sp. Carnegie-2017]|uniref:uncharacterized protein LOC124452658 isoform X2 n=1 Tax=Xenia sp. Carnegie-2017 TaxID=2897299 RepID=UPI001F0431B6|nr:uncharacterized protein LOC124452658 isoform X2 [Xenia sp. Carnegie-2017]
MTMQISDLSSPFHNPNDVDSKKASSMDDIFENEFLDEDYNMKEKVHDVFKSLSWICEGYGTVGLNEKMPYPHLFVTVENHEGKSEEILKKEIDDKFGWNASEYIEFKSKSLRTPRFRLLSNLRVEDSTMPTNGNMQVSNIDSFNDNNNSQRSSSHGTLTMFCRNKENHYALTCAHVACVTDQISATQTFNQENEVSMIIDNVNARNENDGNKYFYQLPNSGEEKQLGSFPCNTVSKFNDEADVMFIPVGNENDFYSLGGGDLENFPLRLKEANKELYQRVDNGYGFVKVRTNSGIKGFIDKRNYSHLCKKSRETIFKNAVKVKCDDQFLKDGDSGGLIYFKDDKNKWQPFAYGVCEIDEEDDDISFGEEKSYICFKLDKALKLLNFKDCEFFREPDDNNDEVSSDEDSVPDSDDSNGNAYQGFSTVDFHSEESREFWNKIRPQSQSKLKEWRKMRALLERDFAKECAQSQVLRFICYVLKIYPFEERDKKYVHDQDFANLVAWFGPVKSGKDGLFAKIKKLAKESITYKENGPHSFFAGYMTEDKADEIINKQTEVGTFLIRFSSTNARTGSFVVCLKTKCNTEHIELQGNPKSRKVSFNGREYDDIVLLWKRYLSKEGVSQDGRTSCSIVCPDLPLNAMFKAYGAGPVASVRGRGRGRGARRAQFNQ